MYSDKTMIAGNTKKQDNGPAFLYMIQILNTAPI
jgi:hypothetical protein